MPFFIHINFINKHTSKQHNYNKPSLRDLLPVILTHRYSFSNKEKCKKRVSSFIFSNNMQASITLEAALIFPFFMFSALSLIAIIDVWKIKGCMDLAVAEVGNEISLETYGEYIDDLTRGTYIKEKIEKFIDNNLTEYDRKKIAHRITVTDTSFLGEKNTLSFRVDYKVIADFSILGFIPVKLNSTYYGHTWMGCESTGETEKMVFISSRASVYHIDRNCSYLNVTIEEVLYESVPLQRNTKGEKYRSCSFCGGSTNSGKVFITVDGTNYHNIKNCIGLTRHIYTVPLSNVSYKNICSRCGG